MATWSRPTLPGQSGMIAAMFISTSTSPAAASSTSIENAFIAIHTAKSWHNQPMSWKTMAAAAAAGRCMTPSPWRAFVQSIRAASALSSCVRSW